MSLVYIHLNFQLNPKPNITLRRRMTVVKYLTDFSDFFRHFSASLSYWSSNQILSAQRFLIFVSLTDPFDLCSMTNEEGIRGIRGFRVSWNIFNKCVFMASFVIVCAFCHDSRSKYTYQKFKHRSCFLQAAHTFLIFSWALTKCFDLSFKLILPYSDYFFQKL